MNSQEAPPPSGPAPGPELSIGGSTGSTNFGGLAPDTLSKLNKLAGVVEAEKAAPKAAPVATPAKPTPVKTEAAPVKPTAATVTTPAAPTTPPDPKPDDAKAQGPKQLREAYERQQARVAELEQSVGATAAEKAEAFTKLAATEAKLTAHEKRIAEEYEPMRKVLEERSKRLTEAEENLRMQDYKSTQEWHDRYVRPIVEVQNEVNDVLAQVAVIDGDQPRAATPQDFAKVLSTPTLNEAERVAKQLFGEGFATTEIVRHSAKLRQLAKAQQTALQNAKVESEQWHQTQQQRQTEMQARMRAFVQQKELEHGGELATLTGDDPELSEALASGATLAETLATGNPNLTPEGWGDVVARSKVAIKRDAVNQKRITRLQGELKAAQDELARYRGSEPTVETRNAGPATEEAEPSDFKSRMTASLLKHAQKKI